MELSFTTVVLYWLRTSSDDPVVSNIYCISFPNPDLDSDNGTKSLIIRSIISKFPRCTQNTWFLTGLSVAMDLVWGFYRTETEELLYLQLPTDKSIVLRSKPQERNTHTMRSMYLRITHENIARNLTKEQLNEACN